MVGASTWLREDFRVGCCCEKDGRFFRMDEVFIQRMCSSEQIIEGVAFIYPKNGFGFYDHVGSSIR